MWLLSWLWMLDSASPSKSLQAELVNISSASTAQTTCLWCCIECSTTPGACTCTLAGIHKTQGTPARHMGMSSQGQGKLSIDLRFSSKYNNLLCRYLKGNDCDELWCELPGKDDPPWADVCAACSHSSIFNVLQLSRYVCKQCKPVISMSVVTCLS